MDTVRLRPLGVAGAPVAGLLLAAPQASAHSPGGLPHAPGAPHHDHVFVVVEENHGYGDPIGNPAAPDLNAPLAEHHAAG
jgi:hypothetical protein